MNPLRSFVEATVNPKTLSAHWLGRLPMARQLSERQVPIRGGARCPHSTLDASMSANELCGCDRCRVTCGGGPPLTTMPGEAAPDLPSAPPMRWDGGASERDRNGGPALGLSAPDGILTRLDGLLAGRAIPSLSSLSSPAGVLMRLDVLAAGRAIPSLPPLSTPATIPERLGVLVADRTHPLPSGEQPLSGRAASETTDMD